MQKQIVESSVFFCMLNLCGLTQWLLLCLLVIRAAKYAAALSFCTCVHLCLVTTVCSALRLPLCTQEMSRVVFVCIFVWGGKDLI